MTFSVLPLSADRTLVRTTWLVHEDAVEGVDYDVDTLTHVWRETNEQDSVFCARAQLGVSSPGYEPGPYAPSEYQVDAFTTWYVDRVQGAPRAMTDHRPAPSPLEPGATTSTTRLVCVGGRTTSPTTCGASCCGRPSPRRTGSTRGSTSRSRCPSTGSRSALLHDRVVARRGRTS